MELQSAIARGPSPTEVPCGANNPIEQGVRGRQDLVEGPRLAFHRRQGRARGRCHRTGMGGDLVRTLVRAAWGPAGDRQSALGLGKAVLRPGVTTLEAQTPGGGEAGG